MAAAACTGVAATWDVGEVGRKLLESGASDVYGVPLAFLVSRGDGHRGRAGRQRLSLCCCARPCAHRSRVDWRRLVRGGIEGGVGGRRGGDGRWRRSVFDHYDLAQTACVVDLLDLAVADGVLVCPLALACRHGGRGHDTGRGVGSTIEVERRMRLLILREHRRRCVVQRSLHDECCGRR